MNDKTDIDRFILELKASGPSTAQEVAKALGVTPAGAHKRLKALAAAGLVTCEDRVVGRGRPSRFYGLTRAGHRLFPDRHAELSVELIAAIRTTFGQEGLDRLIGVRETQQLAGLRMDSELPLADKLALLVRKRVADGYMTRLEQNAGSDIMLIEDHCPICAAATVCQGLCRSELSVFRQVLGKGVRIERDEYLLSGNRRCTYRIHETGRQKADAAGETV